MRITRRAVILGGSLSAVTLAQQQAPEKYPDVPFVPTPVEVIEAMLKLANVHPGDLVYDLGCGDGRIPVMAAEKFGAAGFGVDLDGELIREARARAKKAGVAARVEFKEADLFETDVRPANVVALYLLPKVLDRLKPKLLAELQPGTRVVSFTFPFPDWTPDRIEEVTTRRLYLYIVPQRSK